MLTLMYKTITGPIVYNTTRECFHLVCGDTEYFVPSAKIVATSPTSTRENDVRFLLTYDVKLQRPEAEPLFSMIRDIRNIEECNELDAVCLSYKRIQSILGDEAHTTGDEITVTGTFTMEQMDTMFKRVMLRLDRRIKALMKGSK